MLEEAKNIFIVGIKGVAMANLAVILKKMGKNVSGSDVEEEFISDEVLKRNNIRWSTGFKPDNLPQNVDLVVYSAAHKGSDNEQVEAAKRLNIPVASQAQILGELTRQFKTVLAVAGSHGKTTTSSLLSFALIKLGVKPSYLVGTSSFNEFAGGDFLGTDYFVIEADEYAVDPPLNKTPKFHSLEPDFILCTNIDFDHPDVYKNIQHVQEEFLQFFDQKKLILCADDQPSTAILNELDRSMYFTYGYKENADLRIHNPQTTENSSSFELEFNKKPLCEFRISIFGKKNISNAVGVVLTLLKLGFSSEKIKFSIKDFSGSKRRFEFIFAKNNTSLFDDYGHHPKEIETTILAARERFPGK
ncbi:hypothetical protein HYW87_00580, partial [Candidatus Roizmanbacteria bacterium]|nr:hypothetical protein [Candidatus Roizmanbacteria bacterium]